MENLLAVTRKLGLVILVGLDEFNVDFCKSQVIY